MKKASLILLGVAISLAVMAQSGDELLVNPKIDDLRQQLSTTGNDSLRARLMVQLAESFMYTNMDSNSYYAEAALQLAEQNGFIQEQIGAMGFKAQGLLNIGNLPKAMEISLKAVEMGKHLPARFGSIGPNYDNLGQIYFLIGEYDRGLKYWRQELAIGQEDPMSDAFGNWNIANFYEEINRLDSSLIYLDRSFETFGRIHYSWYPDVYPVYPHWYNTRAKIYTKQGKTVLALQDYHRSLNMSLKNHELVLSSVTCNDLSNFFDSLGQPDSSIYYAEKALEFARRSRFKKGILDAAALLSTLYEPTDPAKALQYLKIKEEQQNSLFGAGNMEAIREMMTQEEVRQKELAAAQKAYQDRLRQYALLGFLGAALLVAFLLYRNNRQKQKTNARLQAQNRELEIEAALERVRVRTTGMHKSDELAEVVGLIYKEAREFELADWGCNIQIIDGAEQMEFWISAGSHDYLPRPYYFQNTGHKAIQKQLTAFKKKENYTLHLQGEEKKSYDDFVMEHTDFKYFPEEMKAGIRSEDRVHFTAAFMKYGYIVSVNLASALSPEQFDFLSRFAKVFEQTYTRFLDLQRAEAQAREAQIDAGLERVRAEIASMRNPDDLQRITPLIWRELTTLGVPFFRCGVFIVDEAAERVHAYLSTPDGAPLGVLHLPFDGAETTRKTVDHWRRGEVYTDFWDRQQFLDWVRSMTEQGFVGESATYQGGEEPPEALALQFVPFTQGMLYVGSTESLPDEQIDLLRRLADTFAVAYARYEDFIKLEEAKNRVEATLTELKATQAQLIQSEKLASLGELTAGIAHEIQNPLNFVNNFAEVSTELVGEMKEELQQGNTEDAVAIAADLEQNLGKIQHHGLRASSIVKSMLQHSRASTGEKEPTDLNALIDECIRLSYHGLRAQDPGFQAKYELELDDNLPKIPVVPQDIGRVLLNLFNNAFYAVNEKRKLELNEIYQPLVRVTTHCTDGVCSIKVEDNGPGIPEVIKEKIFQPFFTTKPTGQGTGLGLSLAYEMVTKGHGGTLEMESEEEKGTTFIARLPAKQTTS